MAVNRCTKCQTLLIISKLEGAAGIKVRGMGNGISDQDNIPGRTGHETLKKRFNQLNRAKGHWCEIWWKDPTETTVPDGLTFAPDSDLPDRPRSALLPNRVGTLVFTSEGDIDGTCNPDNQTGTQFSDPCYSMGYAKEDCSSRIKLTWTFENTTFGNRFGLGVSGGSLYTRDCAAPGTGDTEEAKGDATMWQSLHAAGSTPRTGSRTWWVDWCGDLEKARISFQDATIGAARAGIIDNYFDISIGCESCCSKDKIYKPN